MISLAIPYHDTPNTAKYLSRLLQSIATQTYTDYEIVLTKEGAFARNHNAAIIKSKGEFVQMLGIDDYFTDADALGRIVAGFQSGKEWQITACLHDLDGVVGFPHTPYWTDDIYRGNNRLGSVSTLSFRRESGLLFEEPLTWLVDCDLYYRLHIKYGLPNLLETHNVVISNPTDRVTNTLSFDIKNNEVQYLARKYGN